MHYKHILYVLSRLVWDCRGFFKSTFSEQLTVIHDILTNLNGIFLMDTANVLCNYYHVDLTYIMPVLKIFLKKEHTLKVNLANCLEILSSSLANGRCMNREEKWNMNTYI